MVRCCVVKFLGARDRGLEGFDSSVDAAWMIHSVGRSEFILQSYEDHQ
jgi:hypothetical protein